MEENIRAKNEFCDLIEQNCFNNSVSLSKYAGCAVFYMASVNSRSLGARDLHIFTVRHIFYACTFHTQGLQNMNICQLCQHEEQNVELILAVS